MVDTSNVVILAIVFCFIALFVVIILLIRTTRKVVDNTNVLLKRDADAALADSPVDKLKHDLSCMNQPAKMNDSQLNALIQRFLARIGNDTLTDIYDKYISSGSYDENLKQMGVVNINTPSSIDLYAYSFESKDGISKCIDEYNKTASDEDKIVYTDLVGLLMSSVTTIVNIISYVLIAFVAVSLIVSSIMIGIITYISVLERTKEIGILRAIGASKRNISRVFNAETFIIGLFSGVMGIAISLLMLFPINAVIHAIAENDNVNAFLPVTNALILIALSILLTLIGGIIPSRKAAKKDPVTALRTE